MELMKRVHGHEVMHMMASSGFAYSRESLRAAIHENFGENTRFFTCSADNMSADELISFLESKGKFHPAGAGFGLSTEQICKH